MNESKLMNRAADNIRILAASMVEKANSGDVYKRQGIQSLLAPAMVAVFALGIFSKKITPKAGETAMIVGFLIGMIRLLTNIPVSYTHLDVYKRQVQTGYKLNDKVIRHAKVVVAQ